MQTRISVRPFRAADMQRILQIERASFGADAYERKLFAELFHTCGELFLVAVAGGRICGYMVSCLRGNSSPKTAELISVAVLPSFRGRGAASYLMRNTLRRLRLRGAVRLSLMVKVTNEGARRFYDRHGFRKVRKVSGYYEDGADGVLMRKELKGSS
jgi:[ribosomal protein S18]-alanine N-acetyltransferase